MTLVVRAEQDPIALTPALRSVIRSVDAEQPISDVKTVATMMAERTAARRFILALLAGFAAVALTLACVGLYGVIAYTIAQRQREFSIRLALGASAHGLVRMVMREGAVLVVLGVSFGIALAAVGTRLIASLLFGVEPLDPVVLLAAAAVLSGTAALAAWLPARRAAAADPMLAMHNG
jgi:ABC-type antimicrobial peptide transport system permease subunit